MRLHGSSQYFRINDLLFPENCILCGWKGKLICDGCSQRVDSHSVRLCPICKSAGCIDHRSAINNLWALSRYSDYGVSDLVTGIKYRFQIDLLKYFWRQKLEVFFEKYHSDISGKTLIPIPLHRRKLLRRGFNQAELIAVMFSEISGCRVENDLLIRFKDNDPQARSSGKKRRENAKDIFRVNYRKLSVNCHSPIILVDDVYTTGATALSATEELKKSGFTDIDCLVLACGIMES